jgi:hypothetical protein
MSKFMTAVVRMASGSHDKSCNEDEHDGTDRGNNDLRNEGITDGHSDVEGGEQVAPNNRAQETRHQVADGTVATDHKACQPPRNQADNENYDDGLGIEGHDGTSREGGVLIHSRAPLLNCRKGSGAQDAASGVNKTHHHRSRFLLRIALV